MVKIIKKLVTLLAMGFCFYNDPVVLHASEPIAAECAVKKVIVFDIGGVLTTYAKSTLGMAVFKEVVRECGFFKTIKYAVSHGSHLESRLRNSIFAILEEVGRQNYEQYPVMYDEKGKPHPRGLCLLHAGLISSEEFVAESLRVIRTWCDQDKALCKEFRRLYSSVEVAFVRNTLRKMGNGEVIAKIFKPCKEGMKLLQQAVQTPGVEVMILSNYPVDQFDALLSQPFMKEALSGIPEDHILCSGQWLPECNVYGLAKRRLATKPQVSAFAELIVFCQEKWGIRPDDIIFIDNQAENVLAARSVGIDALLVNSVSQQNKVHACTFKELSKLIDVRLQLAQAPYGLVQRNNNLASLINSVITSKTYAHGAFKNS